MFWAHFIVQILRTRDQVLVEHLVTADDGLFEETKLARILDLVLRVNAVDASGCLARLRHNLQINRLWVLLILIGQQIARRAIFE